MTDKELIFHPIPALRDNYVWTITDEQQQTAVIVDPGEAAPVAKYLEDNNLTLSAILITHHHWDHTNGVIELKEKYGVPVYGPANSQIDGLTNPLHESDEVNLSPLPLSFKILEIPGHTLDHIAYYAPGILLCGDTLFSAGCGRVFEGTGQKMYDTLQKIANLPDDTKIYCAHEYTANNLHFAQLVEPDNHFITHQLEKIDEIRSNNQPSLPSTLQMEKKTNPFLRCTSPELIKAVEKYARQPLPSETEVFIHLRKWKDNF